MPLEDSDEYNELEDELEGEIKTSIEDTIDLNTQVGARMRQICVNLSLTIHLFEECDRHNLEHRHK